MRRIMSFEIFESAGQLTAEQIEFLNKHTQGSWKLNAEGKIDVEGDFDCSRSELQDFKGLRFGTVSGGFICRHNLLRTLEGAPETVGGGFNCLMNSLRTLEGAPKTVGGSFDCSYNSLRTLEGAPETVDRGFNCSHNSLRTLEGAPETVGGNFSCYSNSLESLKGAPETVPVDFDCSDNTLRTLEGAPTSVGRGFDCSYNSLETLEGAPETVRGNFNCYKNSLRSLKGAPETVAEEFDCSDNPLRTLEGAPETVGDRFTFDVLQISKDKWNLEGWLEVLETGNQEQKKLILTLLSPEVLNKRLQEDPEKTMVELKGVWNSPEFVDIRSQLVLPRGLEGEMDLLGDLDGIGL